MNSRSSPPPALPRPRLQRREEIAVEAAAVRERLVGLPPVVGQHRVGEVVVLVDEHVHRDAVVAGVPEQFAQLAVHARMRDDVADRLGGKQVGVPPQRGADLDEAVVVEALPQRLQRVVEGREVEAQDDVARTVVGGPPGDVRAVEDRVPLVGPRAVVVVLQHRHPQALAEAPGTNQDRVALVLQRPEEARLVHVQPAVQADAPDVGLTVGYPGVGCRHRASCRCRPAHDRTHGPSCHRPRGNSPRPPVRDRPSPRGRSP